MTPSQLLRDVMVFHASLSVSMSLKKWCTQDKGMSITNIKFINNSYLINNS